MILHRLDISNFQAIVHESITFRDTGITLIEGPNETGKSSVLKAFGFLISLPSSSKKRALLDSIREGADGAFSITAELTLGEDKVEYSKTFKGRGETSLRFLSSVKPTLYENEAHEYVLAHLEGSANVALWEKLRLDQERPAGQVEGVDQIGPLKRALDLEAGDERPEEDDSLFEAVKAERDGYFGAKGSAKGELKKLEDEVAGSQEVMAAAEEEARGLQKDIDELDSLSNRITEKKSMLAEAAEELVHAEKAAEELRTAKEAQSRFESRKSLAEERKRTAVLESEKRRGLIGSVGSLREKLGSLEQKVEAERTELAGVEKRAAEDEGARAAAEKIETDNAAEAKAAEAAVETLELRRDLVDLERRLQSIDAGSVLVAELEDGLERIAADEGYLDALREAEGTVRVREAELRAGSSRVEISGSGQASVDGSEVDVHAGWSGYAEKPLRVAVGGVSVEVSPPVGAESARETLDAAQSALSSLLAEREYESVASAAAAVREREKLERDLATARTQRDSELGGTTAEALRERVAALRVRARTTGAEHVEDDAAGEIDFDTEIRAAKERRAELADARERARTASAEAAAVASVGAARVKELRKSITDLSARVDSLALEIEELEKQLTAARGDRDDASLSAALEESAAAVEGLAEEKLEVEAAVAKAERNAAVHGLDAARASHIRHQNDAGELASARSKLAELVRYKGGQGLGTALHDAEIALGDAVSRRDAMRARAEAADLLFRTLDKHRSAVIERYSAPLRDKLRHYGRIVFGEDFDVSLGENLDVSARRLDELTVDYAKLSGGAKEQFAILTRLVCVMLVGGNSVPVFLDDTMGYSDPQRRKAMASVLNEAGKSAQIVVLTCDEARFSAIGDAHRHSLG